jgi:opacity protein-like surface antigen
MQQMLRKAVFLVTLIVGIWFLSLLTIAAQATAAGSDKEDSQRRGLYLGAAAGFYGPQLPDDPSGPVLRESADLGNNPGAVFDGRLGYQFCSFFATEVQVQYYGDSDVEYEKIHVGSPDGFSVGGNGKLILPLGNDGGALYALGGAGLLEYDTYRIPFQWEREADLMWRIGAGLDINVTKKVTLNAEVSYVNGTGQLKDVELLPVVFGFRYQFR